MEGLAKLVRPLFLFLFFLFACDVDSEAQTNFYRGKVIRVIVGSSPGGGYDLWARLMARYLGKYIPGNRSPEHARRRRRGICQLYLCSRPTGRFDPRRVQSRTLFRAACWSPRG